MPIWSITLRISFLSADPLGFAFLVLPNNNDNNIIINAKNADNKVLYEKPLKDGDNFKQR